MKVEFFVDNHQLYEGELSYLSWLKSYISIKMNPNEPDKWIFLKIKNPKGLRNNHTYDGWKVIQIHPKDFGCIVKKY